MAPAPVPLHYESPVKPHEVSLADMKAFVPISWQVHLWEKVLLHIHSPEVRVEDINRMYLYVQYLNFLKRYFIYFLQECVLYWICMGLYKAFLESSPLRGQGSNLSYTENSNNNHHILLIYL